jgi:uncharacterized membrane protein
MPITPRLPPLPKLPRVDSAQAARVLDRVAAGVKRGVAAAPDAFARVKDAAQAAQAQASPALARMKDAARAAKAATPAVARAASVTKSSLSSVGWRPNITLRLVAVAGLIGAITHIALTLMIPLVQPNAAFAAFRQALPLHRMTVLPPPIPGAQIMPFMSPDIRIAACRYDITDGPVSVTAVLPEAGWTIALHTPQGENFYTVPAADMKKTEVAFVILPQSDRIFTMTPGVRRANVDATQIQAPAREGLVIIRAPVKGIAFGAETDAQLKSATCAQIKR